MVLQFVLQTEPDPPTCGHKRPRGKVACELPPDHIIGGATDRPFKATYHTGRSRNGSWISWKVEYAEG